ncbi:MAG: hypothetical protein M1814_001104 [Vezdaea aestivalis]|nr:MAG: hypothetical protein M1814_001104 [Vezdaea aestivalis]
MGKPPAVVFVARHGARLDQADKQWINTSATPYDPPLTYGGWTQARAVGARIASILKSREAQASAASSVNGGDDDLEPSKHLHKFIKLDQKSPLHTSKSQNRRTPVRKPTRHKIIIHTSPFLRCVQTSTGIAAGMAQWDSMMRSSSEGHNPRHPHFHSTSGRLHSAGPIIPHQLEAIPEPGEDLAHIAIRNAILKRKKYQKSSLRIDACLGEWLQPEYFELISQPPDSRLMVAGAKSELLRREDYSTLPTSPSLSSSPHQQGFPGGWKTPPLADSPADANDDPLASMSMLTENLPQRDRTNSHSSIGSIGGRTNIRSTPRLSASAGSDSEGYNPPTPTWAISPSDPIPTGYVAHARDSCVDVDYQWDSMRSPQSWGDGGEYGEEWSSMHKRFRKGLRSLLGWYSQHDTSVTSSDVSKGSDGHSDVHDPDEHNEDDVDTVIIIVTHGAGCNALIGALTDSPVLLDIGIASLSMAIRRDPIEPHTDGLHAPAGLFRRRSATSGISDDYKMRLTASTEHLRAGSNPLTIPQLRIRGTSSPAVHGSYRHRVGSDASIEGSNFPEDDPLPRHFSNGGVSSSIGSIRRVASTASSTYGHGDNTLTTPTGLWSPHIRPAVSSFEAGESGEDDMVLNFDTADDTTSHSNSITSLNGSFSEKSAAARNGSRHSTLPPEPAAEDKETAAESMTATAKELELKRPLSIGEAPLESSGKPPQGLWGAAFTIREDKARIPLPKRRWTVDERPVRP